jgi:pimeloyl-ACP methyl ester carboxylesterase
VAAWCALVRPDVFRSVVLMSAPFAGPPPLTFDTADAPARPKRDDPVHRELAELPRPRKHYQWYYSTREANADMHRAPQGVHDFLRAYYHHKSADWKGNKPYPLIGWTASELAKLPTYYVMDFARNMAETVTEEMPSAETIAANTWLPDRELSFYSAEYGRTGFRGGLQWYRCGTSGAFTAELETYFGRSIDVPSCFISGKQDWGTYQRPGVYEAMQHSACTRMLGCHLVEGAGHWVQQEQPEQVSQLLLQFVKQYGEPGTGRFINSSLSV